VVYRDGRGKFEFCYGDGFPFARPCQIAGAAVVLSQAEVDEVVERVVCGIRSAGLAVQVFQE
jgi:hypothetical protein